MNIRLAAAALSAGLLLTACADDVVVDADDVTSEAPADDTTTDAPADDMGTEDDMEADADADADAVVDADATEGSEENSEG